MIKSNHLVPSGVYVGSVMHQRFLPKRHLLRYNLFSIFLDLDDLDSLDRRLWCLSIDRFNIISFNHKDYGDGSKNLKKYILDKIEKNNSSASVKKIYLITMPRILGYVFNPLNVYFCYDENNYVCDILYEVSNTFGERHEYVFHIDSREQKNYSHSCGKSFYVSPFLEMGLVYKFRIRSPNLSYSLIIDVFKEKNLTLRAYQRLKYYELTDWRLIKLFFAYPFMTLKIILAIHFEALLLWLKGIALIPRVSGKINNNKTIKNSNLIGE